MGSFVQVQTVGPAGEPVPLFPDGRNRLMHGDALTAMRALPDACLDAVYLDPPFFSETDYHLHNGERGSVRGFGDTWAGGLREYMDWLEERLSETHRLLRGSGALFLHLDWHAVHYAKVALDRIYGYDCFQNEYIWYYSGGGASKRRFARKHDNILFYSRTPDGHKFYPDRVRVPYKWTEGQPRADGSERDLEKGKLPDDVWEHHALMPWSHESMGYPTQKPEALLERLLLATTDVGDVVADFVCGSGTTPVVAQKNRRRWIASDESRIAVCLTSERLAEIVAPGCIEHTAQRSRARAKDRFDRIMSDETRLGLDQATLAATKLALFEERGFAVEGITGP
jgi:DNA modification methylase